MSDFDLRKLSKKFNEEEIEWRVQQCGMNKNGGAWAMIIPYITSRAIMQRLDDVVGAGGWKNEFVASPCRTGYLCGISIKIDGEWITRWDGAKTEGNGGIDPVKSTISSAMKRTGVQWGIGRYLYQFDSEFADAELCDYRSNVKDGYTFQQGKTKDNVKFGFQWKAKALQRWALPITTAEVEFNLSQLHSASTMNELKNRWLPAYRLAESECDSELMKKFEDAKESAKARISESEVKADNENLKKLGDLINKHINIIGSGVNESAVNGLSKIAIADIGQTARGNSLKDAENQIRTAVIIKLNQLKGNQS